MRKEDFLSRNIHFILSILFIVSLIFFTAIGFVYFNTFNGEISLNHERWGTFGDFFGGTLNPIFSLLAFFALLLTIVIQNRELGQTRKEFEKSSSALQEQSRSIRIQIFENTFFKLISLHNEIVESLVYEKEEKRRCFKEYILYLNLSSINRSIDDTNKKIPANYNYNLHYDNIAHSVEHYHKNLYQILFFVDHADESLNKKQYTNFLRSQLSRDELHVLFFHGLSKFGYEKFKPLIEKYEILEHLPANTFLLKENMYLYNVEAFGKNEKLREMHKESSIITAFGPIDDVISLNESD